MSNMGKILIAFAFCEIVNSTVIRTKYGHVKGKTEISRSGREFFAFYNIPFAAPPLGRLRLKDPTEPAPWKEIRDATEFPPTCIQSNVFPGRNITQIIGQEDCLYLNVFTHQLPADNAKKLPVMVYIHGGAFQVGWSAYERPHFLMDKDIVFVSANYRLGALGFLGMGEEDFSGNFGIKDQSFALKWVHENIVAFGGNPRDVTLFGCSAGAASVHLQMFIPKNRGLFHKAVLQSGSAFSTWAVNSRKNGRLITTAFAVSTTCYRKKIRKMLECLQDLEPVDFVGTETKMMSWEDEPSPLFVPMVEGDVYNAALPDLPHERNYVVKNIPWIVGLVTAEGAFKAARYLGFGGEMAKALNKNHRRYIPIINHYSYISDPDNLDKIADSVREYYFGTREIGPETDTQLVNMLSDAIFLYPAINSILSNQGKTYVYLYDHPKRVSEQSHFGDYKKHLGVCHGDDLFVLFYNERLNTSMTNEDVMVSIKMVNFWTNFAIYGNPNGSGGSHQWTPTRTKNIEYLRIGTEKNEMESNFYTERYHFWDSLPLGIHWLISSRHL